eukprot:9233429-Pyramimonas_sp.AAC.1
MQVLHSWVRPVSSAPAGGTAPGCWKLREHALGVQRLEALGRRLAPTMWGSGGSESCETPNCLSFHGVPSPRNQTMAAHVRLYT